MEQLAIAVSSQEAGEVMPERSKRDDGEINLLGPKPLTGGYQHGRDDQQRREDQVKQVPRGGDDPRATWGGSGEGCGHRRRTSGFSG
jgi:hypothetical protein